MKRFRWQLIIVVLALVVIGILLLSQQPETIVQVSAPEPVTGGVYTEGLVGSFSRLNPVLDIHNLADQDINRLLYNSLVRL
jgi:hypothetical protein